LLRAVVDYSQICVFVSPAVATCRRGLHRWFDGVQQRLWSHQAWLKHDLHQHVTEGSQTEPVSQDFFHSFSTNCRNIVHKLCNTWRPNYQLVFICIQNSCKKIKSYLPQQMFSS